MKNNVSDSELKLAIDLIRVCALSSEVLAITEARWPIEEVQIFTTPHLRFPGNMERSGSFQEPAADRYLQMTCDDKDTECDVAFGTLDEEAEKHHLHQGSHT